MRLRHLFVLSCLAVSPILAQPVVAPTNEPLGKPRGEEIGDYNMTSSIETGYRFYTVDGNAGKYRSDVNFRNGLRVLGGSFTLNSKDGHGHYFDELVLNVQGLGNDPYQFSSLRLQKNGLYRYDLLWRENDYYNPGLTIANGQHFTDTSHRLQDHSLTLFPQSKVNVFLGYSRNVQDGPALSTIQIFDSRGEEFPYFADIRREQNEYRVGGDVQALGWKLSLLRTWEFFKDDTQDSLSQPSAGNNPADKITLTSFQRSQPYHGSTDSWRINLLNDRHKFYSVNSRFAYAGGRRDFIVDENLSGTNRFGAAQALQTLVYGNARRPVTAANLTLNIFPSDKLTIVNHTSYHHTRMDGDGAYSQFNNNTLSVSTVDFQFLGIETVTNSTDVNYRFNNWIGLYGGYQYSNRQIRSIEQLAVSNTPDRLEVSQDNTLHSGVFGFRLRPIKPLTISIDTEIGRNNNPFYPISERNYHALGGRVLYKARKLTLSGQAKTNYNTNSVSLSAHSSKSRTYSADASWNPIGWFALDAAYSKIHLDTVSGIAYFVQGDLLNGSSVYISNIHAGSLSAHFTIRRRVDVYAGFNRVQDTGDGRSAPSLLLNANDPNAALTTANFYFYAAQTFPLTFESPLARVSVRITPKLRWNAGWQFYHYKEEFSDRQNYRANTGFTSLAFSF